MRLFLGLAIALLSAAAHAGELPRDPMLQLLIYGETDPVDMGSDYLFGLSEASLADKAASSGATVRSEGRGDFSFACMTNAGTTTWLLSDDSDSDGEPLLTAMVVSSAVLEATDCDAVPELETEPVDSNLPGIGSDIAAIEARFGSAEVSEDGLVAFRSHDVAGDGGGSWELIKTVTYHVTEELVDAVAYEVVTVH
jgi:hypothetical protein